MLTFTPENHSQVLTAGAKCVLMAVAAGILFLTNPAAAQQPAKPAPAPAKKAPQDKKETGSSWVKLCQKQKDVKKEGKVCLVHHERFHPTTGQPLISAAVRKIEGKKEEMILVMVPLGRLLKPGLAFKVDDDKANTITYSYCTALGCVAEMQATDEIIGKLKKGSILIIGTVDVKRKRIGFKIPLTGFKRAYEGPPIDNKVYAKARKEMFDVIRARQIELVKRAKEAAEQKKKAAGGGAAPKKAP